MSTERYVDDQGRVIDSEVMPDHMRELQVVRVVSLTPTVVELLSNGRAFQVYKRLASLDVAAVTVGTLLLACRVEQGGIIILGEVI